MMGHPQNDEPMKLPATPPTPATPPFPIVMPTMVSPPMDPSSPPALAVDGTSDGDTSGGEDLELPSSAANSPPQLRERDSLSAHAPAFVPPPRPHTVSVFNPMDYSTATRQCNLTALTLGELRQFAQESFPVPASLGFELLLNGQALPNDPSVPVLDAGIANGGVVVMVTAQAPVPVAVPGLMQRQQQIMQIQLLQGQLQAPAASGFAPVVAGGPAPQQLFTDAFQQQPRRQSPEWTGGGGGSPGSRPTEAVDGLAQPQAREDYSFLMTNPDGSRRLVQLLRQGNQEALSQAMTQCLPRIKQRFVFCASNPQAAKVVIQIAQSSQEAAQQLMRTASQELAEVLESPSGSEVLTALLDAAPVQDVRSPSGMPVMVEALCRSIVGVSTTVSGRKLLQEVTARLPAQEAASLYDSVCQNMLAIATDQCGCITLQRLCDGAGCFRPLLQRQLMDSAAQLITDPYGNYAVQHAVKDSPQCSALVARTVAGRIREFAVNKFASNVIERCLQTGPDEVRELLIPEVATTESLQLLMQDAYGNYVVQSCVDHSPTHLLPNLRDAVLPLVSRSPYGYRIETKLQRRLRHDKRGGGAAGGGRSGRGGYGGGGGHFHRGNQGGYHGGHGSTPRRRFEEAPHAP